MCLYYRLAGVYKLFFELKPCADSTATGCFVAGALLKKDILRLL